MPSTVIEMTVLIAVWPVIAVLVVKSLLLPPSMAQCSWSGFEVLDFPFTILSPFSSPLNHSCRGSRLLVLIIENYAARTHAQIPMPLLHGKHRIWLDQCSCFSKAYILLAVRSPQMRERYRGRDHSYMTLHLIMDHELSRGLSLPRLCGREI